MAVKVILTPTKPVRSGRPQRESNPGPPHQESRALPTELLESVREKERVRKRQREKESDRNRQTIDCSSSIITYYTVIQFVYRSR